MPKFNKPGAARKGAVDRIVNHPQATTNLEGGLAFEMAAKTRLYMRVCTSMVSEAKFYKTGEEHDNELLDDLRAVAAQDPQWIFKLAAYARNEMYLRSVSTMILAEAAGIPQCRPFVVVWAPGILKRADELQEVLAYRLNKYGKPIPMCLRRGIAAAVHNFDEYQLAKYDMARKGDAVTMQDVLRLCHPKPRNAAESALFRYLVRREDTDYALLPKIDAQLKFNQLNADTDWDRAKELIEAGHVSWEVAVSKFGNKKIVWDALDLPFMAGLRNLRNLIQSGADLTPVLDQLKNREAVKRSKQLPFRFYSAAAALEGGPSKRFHSRCRGGSREEKPMDPFMVRAVKRELEKALEFSVDNIPKLPGRTCVLVDISGSMTSKVAGKSAVACMDIAALFGAACGRAMDALVCAFTTSFVFVDVTDLPILKGMEAIKASAAPESTYAHLPILQLTQDRTKVDRIILLSDMQCYSDRDPAEYGYSSAEAREFGTAFAAYKACINPGVKLISVDLTGYGTAVVLENEPNVALLAGWSDRVFDFIELFERGATDAGALIANYVPRQRTAREEGAVSE